jgi:hypothetical protein
LLTLGVEWEGKLEKKQTGMGRKRMQDRNKETRKLGKWMLKLEQNIYNIGSVLMSCYDHFSVCKVLLKPKINVYGTE